jgi:hypothetical protein
MIGDRIEQSRNAIALVLCRVFGHRWEVSVPNLDDEIPPHVTVESAKDCQRCGAREITYRMDFSKVVGDE